MSADLPPDERVRRVKAALAEAGWPDADVEWRADAEYVGPSFHCADRCRDDVCRSVPCDVGWRALVLVDGYRACWACHAEHPEIGASPCTHDPLTSPWPPVSRSEGGGE